MKKTFYLDRENGRFLGVCSGIAAHTGWDPTIVRVGLVVATLAGGWPWTVVAYFAAALIGKKRASLDVEPARAARLSTYELNASMRDVDRRMAEVEQYVAVQDNSLAREIESLR
ncbi:MAG TPA: PspC domain-containing protein [Allosphingosinicella sp.]|nr:PspC domain-containing protein [Allosphingosinicella sp.]